jgi:hypothetical protein
MYLISIGVTTTYNGRGEAEALASLALGIYIA